MVASLSERICSAHREALVTPHLAGYPFDWQTPAATEKTAYELMFEERADLSFQYLGFPWATLIDGLGRGVRKSSEMLAALSRLVSAWPDGKIGRATVAQHIHALEYTALFSACGVTDLFWSHAIAGQEKVDGMNIHPFPLFPAQAPDPLTESGGGVEKEFTLNFVGAYNPHIYLSDVRQAIFDEADNHSDFLIVMRDAWHFDRSVYEEQIQNLPPEKRQLEMESRRAAEYTEAIKKSWFTLCPTGSGPNSIRIFESLSLGSIPIVLTKELRLPGDQNLWREAAIFEEDSRRGLRLAIDEAQELSTSARARKIAAGQELFHQVGPPGYAEIIKKVMA